MLAPAANRTRFLHPAFEEWRSVARRLIAAEVAPDHVTWNEFQLGLIAGSEGPAPTLHDTQSEAAPALAVPRDFMRVAATVACHRAPHRWDLLFRVLWRIHRGEKQLLSVATDPDVHRLIAMEKAVRRAAHKMKAFVRFRRVNGEALRSNIALDGPFVAWFEPAHEVVERVAPFFARRFAAMQWSILTPCRCAHWDGSSVHFTAGVSRLQAPVGDELEELWRDYYASTFNPARLAVNAMRAEMPKGYWHNLPESRLIPDMIRAAPIRVAEMIERAASAPEELPAEFRSADIALPPSPRTPRPSTVADLSSSWDPVHDPGVYAAREREMRVPREAAKKIDLGDVQVHAGVAGWTDPSLLIPGLFYPDNATSADARLRYYASRFAMVEVDSTYYSLPGRENSVLWVRRTPDDFIFNIKANALMTGHAADIRQMPDWLRRAVPRSASGSARIYGRDLPRTIMEEVWQRFLSALEPLITARKLGAVFLQFPRWFEPGRAAEKWLAAAARQLGDVRGAIEFRNPAWNVERTFKLLEYLNLAYTVVDAPQGTRSSMPPVVRITRPDFAVVRLHGRRTATWEKPARPVTERYRYLYDADQIAFWSQQVIDMSAWMGRGIIQVSYNNNHANYATTNAQEFADDIRSRRRGTWSDAEKR